MKAVRHVKYGSPDHLRIEEVEKPSPKERQVLIKVQAASINARDWRSLRAEPFIMRFMGGGVLRPKDPQIGSDVAGLVEVVGENVTQFRPGDAVFGFANGSFAEYTLARETSLVKKPDDLSFEHAAALPTAGISALQMIRKGCAMHASRAMQPGQRVVIQGASGGVGMFGVQMAKHSGAEVTAVCSARNMEMVRSLGADHVIDYRREDFTRNHNSYDFIFGVNGYHSIYDYRRALKPGGVYLCAGGSLTQIFQSMLLGPKLTKDGKKLAFMGIAKVDQEDLVELANMLSAGTLQIMIDRTYPLDETIAAMRYVEQKHAQGKIVLTVSTKERS